MAKIYFKIMNSKVEVLRDRIGQIGEFVGYVGTSMLRLRFNDGETFCCFPDEIERVTKGQMKRQRMLNQLETIGHNPMLFAKIWQWALRG